MKNIFDLSIKEKDFLNEIEYIHSWSWGEAYSDGKKYCTCCVDKYGGHKIWPCKTLKKIRKFLELQ